MLATLAEEPFSRRDWLFEPKLDGERCLVFRRGATVDLYSRNQKQLNAKYPELVAPFRKLKPERFILDGEIVTFEGAVTSFAKLQQRMQVQHPSAELRKRVPIWFYALDVLYLDTYDLRQVALRRRKQILQEAFEFQEPLRLTEYRETEGESYFREACERHWEGIVAKDGGSAYISGRSREWLKFKCVGEQEFVIAGYTDPQGQRVGFGALLVGYYDRGKLKYAGEVETGYSNAILTSLGDRLARLGTSVNPFETDGLLRNSPHNRAWRGRAGRVSGPIEGRAGPVPLPRSGVHWVKPRLVAQVGFTEWCRRQTSSSAVPGAPLRQEARGSGARKMSVKPTEILRVNGRDVGITRPEKVLFPKDGITKRDVIGYYERVSRWMLPHLNGRPVAMQRYPDGIDKPSFFQKAAAPYYPEWIRKVTVPKAGGTVTHVVCDDAATLVYLANQACLTPHVWLSRANKLRLPDQMIFDLDPSVEDIAALIRAAHALQELLENMGLPPYVKATGSRGLHVVVPLQPKEDFDSVRATARQIATIVVDRDPEAFTMQQSKSKRGGRIFFDTNRNAYAQTAVAPYALRARDGAPVAVPLDWSELRKKNFRPDGVTLRTIFGRLEKSPNPWKDFARHAGSLETARRKLEQMEHSHAA